MNHKEFLTELQKSCQADSHQCATLLNALQKIMVQAAVDQIPVALPGLGTFISHKHPEYIQENPQTGEQTLFPPRISYRMQYDMSDQPQQYRGKMVAEDLAEYTQFALEQADQFLRAMSQIIATHVLNREEVTIHGFGNFHVIETHQSGLQRIAFTPDEQMRSLVNAPFNCFEPVIIASSEEHVVDVCEIPEDSLSVEQERANGNTQQQDITIQAEANQPLDNAIETIQTIESTDRKTNSTQISANQMEEQNTTLNQNDCPQQEKQIAKETDSPKEKKDSSSNTFLYSAIAIVLLACIAFAIYIYSLYSGSEEFASDKLYEASFETVEEDLTDIIEAANTGDEMTFDEDSIADAEAEAAFVEALGTESNTETLQPESATSGVQAATMSAEATKPAVSQSADAASPFHRQKDANGSYVKVTLQQGDRLTTIAQKHLGDKSFWPYIFEVNTDKLKSPDLIQAGMVLYLPDSKFYDINPSSASSLQKARNYSAKFIK